MQAGDQSPYVAYASAVEGAIRAVSVCHHLRGPDADDFGQEARLHFLRDNCGVLRRFRGLSSIETYLYRVAQNVYLNWQDKRYGRWRPSAAAKRLGSAAVRLERLVVRDGLKVSEALALLPETEHALLDAKTTGWLRQHAAEFVSSRARLGLTLTQNLSGSSPITEAPLAAWEAETTACRLRHVLTRLVSELPPLDQWVLRARFGRGLTVRAIASMLGQQPRYMYGHLERVLHRLRHQLLARHLSREDLDTVLAGPGIELDMFAAEVKRAGTREETRGEERPRENGNADPLSEKDGTSKQCDPSRARQRHQ
jgi:RNA polymerase sigma factor for flagellar operon FliA